MPRSLRFEFPGAFYHVMARGNRRKTIFHDEDDRRFNRVKTQSTLSPEMQVFLKEAWNSTM